MQLRNYQNISNTLIQDNNAQEKKLDILYNEINLLEKERNTFLNERLNLQNEQLNLQEKVILLEQQLLQNSINIENSHYILDHNQSNQIEEPTPLNTNDTDNEIDNNMLKPNITLDEEQNISGFNIQYNQNF